MAEPFALVAYRGMEGALLDLMIEVLLFEFVAPRLKDLVFCIELFVNIGF